LEQVLHVRHVSDLLPRRAYLASKQGGEAISEFQKILDHPGVAGNQPIGALAHLGLARGYVLHGDTAKAKTAYQDFLTLWQDADPDIPVLIAAKAEYAKLYKHRNLQQEQEELLSKSSNQHLQPFLMFAVRPHIIRTPD
jgi:hypothetical protein